MSNDDSTPVTQSAKVFISYRRDDSAGHAGRLFDQINRYFGDRVRIFMDVDSIGPGEDFVNVIESAVASCEILIVVIGRHWLTVTDEDGKRRLDNPEDFIRIEVAAALKRNIRVIPVMVQGAVMPRRGQLPEPLANLSRRNAIELSDARWKYDVDRLIQVIDEVVKKQPGSGLGKAFEVKPPWRPRPWQIGILLIVLGLILGLWQFSALLRGRSNGPGPRSSPTPVTSPTTQANETPAKPDNSPATSTPSPAQTETRARLQVVRVALKNGWSRGFFTNKGYIIAMAPGQMLNASEETTVTWSQDSGNFRELAQVVQVNDWVALLKLKRGLLPGDTPIRNSTSLKEGDTVERFINVNDKTQGVVVGVNVKGMKPQVLMTTKMSAPGDSGAPVIDSRGRIVAMVLGGSQKETQSLPIEIIRVRFPEAF